MLTPRQYRPRLDGPDAIDHERRVRLRAMESAHNDPIFAAHFPESNKEEQAYADALPTSFTKGLYHDLMGNVARADYESLVTMLNDAPEPGTTAEVSVPNAKQKPRAPQEPLFWHETRDPDKKGAFKTADMRLWESPLGGLNSDLQGPAPAAVGLPPAPAVGGSELTAELAEVYAMALMRDVPFTDIEDPNATFDVAGQPVAVQEVIDELNNLDWFDATRPAMSGVAGGLPAPLSWQEQRRRSKRFAPHEERLSVRSLFRGSTAGAMTGPYLSQFMLLGSKSLGADDGKIAFGSQVINQRSQPDAPNLDYMTDFLEWRDVQNGADFKNVPYKANPQFLSSMRDVASYVHVDQLYQAYFNAALIMADAKLAPDHGFPNANKMERVGFATWGVPHLLALLAEVSSRALKAVRRQKFQIHRRARPEALAAKLALVASGHHDAVGQAEPQFDWMLSELENKTPNLMAWIAAHNAANNGITADKRGLKPLQGAENVMSPSLGQNYLLPMAFAEGSPMHPAYGAGHATVAGACVTVLKAFFQTVDDTGAPVPWSVLDLPADRVGDKANLAQSNAGVAETITGELDKLAANISVGRNMAGVHYYTDYYE